MTDKEKIIAYIDKLLEKYPKNYYLLTVAEFIDSLQEEPKECMYSKDDYTDEDRKTLCVGCEEECRFNKKKEPISEEFEKALAEEWQGYVDRGAATVDALEDNTQELAFAKGFYRGWHYRKEEPVSKDLEEFINTIKLLTSNTALLTFEYGCHEGAKWQKQQLLAKAVDAVVKIDAGGYPYVDRTIELYDYDKDIPLAKRGDKVKILVIKEE